MPICFYPFHPPFSVFISVPFFQEDKDGQLHLYNLWKPIWRATEEPPLHCPICEDERQYVNPLGQSWTTHDELDGEHHNVLRILGAGPDGY